MPVQSIVPTSTIAAPLDFTSNLSPDALMVYLSTRLNGLDEQINAIFNTQQDQEKVQSALRKIQAALGDLDATAGTDGKGPAALTDDQINKINAPIEEIRAIDPHLADAITAQLHSQGNILFAEDTPYVAGEVTGSKTYIDGLSKDIESSSQMNMIHLQSIMSARQTAIQLSTNLISALGESSKAIAANIGR
jgi:hypothetical protein